MRIRRLALLAIVVAVTVLLPLSCDLGSLSIAGRIGAFSGDLNKADRSTVYLNFHPTLTADYAAITGDPTVFDTTFPYTYQPYSITVGDVSDPTNVVCSIDAAGGGFGGPYSIVFKMAQDGLDWMIEELDFAGGTLVIQ